MYSRLFSDHDQYPGVVFGDHAPGSGLMYADEIGQPRYGVITFEDIGDILNE